MYYGPVAVTSLNMTDGMTVVALLQPGVLTPLGFFATILHLLILGPIRTISIAYWPEIQVLQVQFPNCINPVSVRIRFT